ncbi:MAG TPA: hypothetical protein VF988_10840 [Verrucomicrobiae bacterium]
MKYFLCWVVSLASGCLALAQTNAPVASTNLAAAPAKALTAHTNTPAKKPTGPQQLDISSDHGYFDGKTSQMIYSGHVYVTDNAQAKLRCEVLTVDVPAEGGHPTNIIAETGVQIDYVDGEGDTNHVTCNKAVYSYGLVTNQLATITNGLTVNKSVVVTNEIMTFTGGDPLPKVENPKFAMVGDPLYLDIQTRKFGGGSGNYHMTMKHMPASGNGTNGTASPFNFLQK